MNRLIKPLRHTMTAALIVLSLQGLAEPAPIFELPEWWFPMLCLVSVLLAIVTRLEAVEQRLAIFESHVPTPSAEPRNI
jgi:hypothetical protein